MAGRHQRVGGATLEVVTARSLVRRMLDWLRAGYPEDAPGSVRVPLLALLRPKPLTQDEIKRVVRNITADNLSALADGVITRDAIAKFISEVTRHDAGPENVRRVAARLAAEGWPLAAREGGTPPD